MFRLRVLGGFALEAAGEGARPRPQRRGDAVLAVLAVSGDFGCTRERVAALLWPEADDARSRHSLRDALHAIRRALSRGAVVSGGRLLRLDPSVVAADVVAFSEARASGRLADAVRAYAGPLLDGFHVDDAPAFERWLDAERARLAREYAEALAQLAMAAERAAAWHEAVGWWARAVEHDPLNSHVVLRHVSAMAAIGDRANAIKLADAHVRRLRDELDVAPDRDVLASVQRIREGKVPAATAPPPPPLAAAPSAAASPPAGVGETTPRRMRWVAVTAVVVVLATALGLGTRLLTHAANARRPRTAIAVLPFETLGADSSHAYLAGGLHDELLTQLARVASLRVVGRVSVGTYRGTSKTPRQIGDELGVGSIVEASVQVDDNRLRVIAQLVDPVTGAELWTEHYDRTLDDAFAVESDIAREIVTAVGATLTSAEAGAIAVAPTENPRAYAFYLQGLEYRRRPGALRQNLEAAQQLFERALALDRSFAPAHAEMSSVHWAMYYLRYDPSESRLELARREADTALRIAPNLPQAHLAVSLARYLEAGDYRAALRELQLGIRDAPNDAELWAWIGRVWRTLGEWDSAVVAFAEARRLDPRDADLSNSVGNTFHYLHRYPEAIAAYRQALALAPDLVEPHLSLAWSYVEWRGELDTLRAVLGTLPLVGDPGGGGDALLAQRLSLVFWERRPDSILSLLRAAHAGSDLSAASSAHWAARAYLLRGDTVAARAAFGSALGSLELAEPAARGAWDVHAERGLLLAELGRRAEARREARWLEQSDVYREDRFHDGWVVAARALILMRVGETDAALGETERLLAGPSITTAQEIRLNPNWDPIRGDPRLQALLAKYADPEAH
jgi:TolB-like protein/DNA-binding SARP family transcriptional activator/Flp pilus assembly protein TadD